MSPLKIALALFGVGLIQLIAIEIEAYLPEPLDSDLTMKEMRTYITQIYPQYVKWLRRYHTGISSISYPYDVQNDHRHLAKTKRRIDAAEAEAKVNRAREREEQARNQAKIDEIIHQILYGQIHSNPTAPSGGDPFTTNETIQADQAIQVDQGIQAIQVDQDQAEIDEIIHRLYGPIH